MAVYSCSRCGDTFRTKQAQLYWRLFYATGFSIGWKEVVCNDCIRMNVQPLVRNQLVNDEGTDFPTCNSDGIVLDDDRVSITLSAFLPQMEAETFDLQVCQSCADALRAHLSSHGRRLPDREPVATSTRDIVESAWVPLGIRPNV